MTALPPEPIPGTSLPRLPATVVAGGLAAASGLLGVAWLIGREPAGAPTALVTGLAVAAAAAVIGVALARRRCARPLSRLRQGLADVSRWEDGARLALDGNEEARAVALLVNQLAERLEAREQAFAALADQSPDGIVQLDADGTVLYANEALTSLLAATAGSLVGRLAGDVVPSALADAWMAMTGDAAGSARTVERECRLTLAGGDRILDIRCRPERRGDRYTGRALLVHRDVTEAHRAAEALRQAQKLDSIGRLAGGIAHDFNNLLGAFVGHAELAMSELPTGHPATADLVELRDAAMRATGMTRQLLTFARQQPPAMTTLDPVETIRRVEGLLRRLLPAQVALVVQPDEQLPPIRADHAQFEQVLVNLVVNARDAMPAGGTITIRTTARAVDDADASRIGLDAAGRYVAFEVTDTGHGMTPEVMTRLFEPFFTTKAPGKGTGLGLATCYGIARHHGGALTVSSRVGAGSAFTLLVPAADDVVPDRGEPETTPLRLARTGHETLLVVDDDDTMRRLVVRALTANGYATIEATDGATALQRLLDPAAPHVDLVLTDVAMPRIDGLALAAQVRRMRPGLPVVFVTGDGDTAASLAGTPEERAILAKPFTTAQLCYAVRAALDAALDAGPAPSDASPSADADAHPHRRPHWSRWAHTTTSAVAP